MTRWFSLGLLAVILAGCGSGSGDLPPVRPSSIVSGHAIDAEIKNGQVAIYAFGRAGKGERLGGGVTDENGFYSIELRAPSQPVLIEVSGGRYTEEASGVVVSVGEGQVLRAPARYVSGQPLSLMVTPLTHLAAGLAEYEVARGTEPSAAVETATASMNALFGLAVGEILPRNISANGDPADQLTAAVSYGFFLAALSSFTQWASQQNNLPTHTTYTSMAFAQVMYNDIRGDGLLDGRGLSKSGGDMTQLALGGVVLNQDVYRITLAQHMLAITTKPQNKTGLTRNDLRDRARALATNSHAVFGGKVPATTSAFAPAIVPKLEPGSAFNGVYTFEVVIDSVLGAETVRFDVNGVTVGDAVDPTRPAVAIDTRNYSDGEYTIGVAATDFLGYSSYQQFKYRFDNIFVNITSAPATNQTPFVLTGNYGDNGHGLKSLTIQGQTITPAPDKTWSAQVQLTLGRNHIPIVIATENGLTETSEAIADYDVGTPVIDTNIGHGNACFANTDGNCTMQALADENAGTPIVIATDHADLAGVAVTRAALNSNHIPYFAFAANDPLSHGVATSPDDLQVRMRYEKDGNAVTPWRIVAPVSGQYLLPLATEPLGEAWLRSAPANGQTLRVSVTDKAGNSVSKLFTFKVQFIVAPFSVSPSGDVAATLFANTAFVQRTALFGAKTTVVEYTFTNTTGKAFYLLPSDKDSVHTVDNLIDQLVRENQARLKTTTEWRAGFIENQLQLNQCPSLPKDGNGNDKWTPVTQILNNIGVSSWVLVKVPDASLGGVQPISADNPAPPPPSAWTQIADFDGTYGTNAQVIQPGMTLSYEFDYILDIPSVFRPAAVRNWRYVDSTSGTPITTTCPNVNFLQQRQSYSYQSEPGFPRNTASTRREGASFITSDVTVFDVTANADIVPVQGWFRIPANHAVRVRKQVVLPTFAVHNDTEVATPDSFSSYTLRSYDRTLTWTIKRALTLTLAHDAGEENLNAMATRAVVTGEGAATYQVSR